MPTQVYVQGHGTIAKFANEVELQTYDKARALQGKATFPVGAKFGVERTVTAVTTTGKSMLITPVTATSTSAPMTAYGATMIGSVPYVDGKPVISVLPATPGTYYGIAPLVLLAVLIFIAVIAYITYNIVAILAKAMEIKNPKESSYTDNKGCVHKQYVGGGGGFMGGYGGITDINTCTAEIQNQGGYTPFLGSGTGTGLGTTLGSVGWVLIGVGVVGVVGYVAFKKLAPHVKKIGDTVKKDLAKPELVKEPAKVEPVAPVAPASLPVKEEQK